MTRENAAAKGRRYLLEGRVVVTEVNRHRVAASVRGDGHLYRAGWEHGRWSCACPARSDSCSPLPRVQTELLRGLLRSLSDVFPPFPRGIQ